MRKFVNDVSGKFKIALKDDADKTVAVLLWGDHVTELSTSGGNSKVKARGQTGWVPSTSLSDTGLLELYVIDVGQGDGVLMRTPNDQWHVIDAGVSNERQMTKKGAANFIRWKFVNDLGKPVQLENVILSHPDFDHYGGLIDLFKGEVQRPYRSFPVVVKNFYHCGVGRFAAGEKLGKTRSGTVPTPPFDDYGIETTGEFITELLDGKGTFTSPSRPFDDAFDEFAKQVAKASYVKRLTHESEYLPGYTPDDGGDVSIRVLGPILERPAGGVPGYRVFDSESVTRNGHSIVLRVDYDKIRLLLTGDLNTASQRLLLSYHPLEEFASDIVKGCHHGSDDIDLRFVKAMKARVTIVSSGDNEDYAHPRPRVLGASARYGREAKPVKGNVVLPPLIYSTELARSVLLRDAAAVRASDNPNGEIDAATAEGKARAKGAAWVPFEGVPIATDLIYGLINVRTDGTRVVCAYMKEAGMDFDIVAFRGGVEP